MHHHAAQLGIVLQLLHQLRHVGQHHCRVLALHQHTLDGVEAQAAYNLLLVVAHLVDVGHQQVGQLHSVAQAGAIAHLHAVQTDVLEQRFDKLGAQLSMTQLEADAVDALHQDVEGLLVSLRRVCHYDVLTNIPLVVVFLVATHEGEFARQRVGRL